MRNILFILLIMLAVSCRSGGYSDDKAVSEDLMREGLRQYAANDMDSALLLFRILADRYDEGMSRDEKVMCAKAMNDCGLIYFHDKLDFPRAFDAFNQALSIAEEMSDTITMANVYANLGNMYTYYTRTGLNEEVYDKAIDYYRLSFRYAAKQNEWGLALAAFCNMVTIAHDYDVIRPEFELYGMSNIPADAPFYEYSRKYYQMLQASYDNNDQGVLDALHQLLATPTPFNETDRANCEIYAKIVSEFEKAGRLDSAMVYARHMKDASRRGHWIYDELHAQKIISDLLFKSGDTVQAGKAYLDYCHVKDSAMAHIDMMMIDNQKFVARLRHTGAEMNRARKRAKMAENVALLVACMLVVAVPLIVVIVKRSRKLRESYHTIYQTYKTLCDKELEESLRREQRRSPSTADQPGAEDMRDRILYTMDHSSEIFSPDFSMEQLASLTGIKPRQLSGILNDVVGKSFYELLNEYRVREACRRINDVGNFGNLTIEAISQSVGYKSRATMIAAFKRYVGMTPSQYQQQSHSKS